MSSTLTEETLSERSPYIRTSFSGIPVASRCNMLSTCMSLHTCRACVPMGNQSFSITHFQLSPHSSHASFGIGGSRPPIPTIHPRALLLRSHSLRCNVIFLVIGGAFDHGAGGSEDPRVERRRALRGRDGTSNLAVRSLCSQSEEVKFWGIYYIWNNGTC